MTARVEVVVRYRRVAVSSVRLARLLRRAASVLDRHGEFTVALIGDREMAALNERFRGVPKATDVLAFPSDSRGYLGDVAISLPAARRQAEARGHSVAREVQILALHGWLHLLGYDHETDGGKMLRLQGRLQRALGLAVPAARR